MVSHGGWAPWPRAPFKGGKTSRGQAAGRLTVHSTIRKYKVNPTILLQSLISIDDSAQHFASPSVDHRLETLAHDAREVYLPISLHVYLPH